MKGPSLPAATGVRRAARGLLALTLCGVAAWALASARTPAPLPGGERMSWDPTRLDRSIAFWERRVRQDPDSVPALNLLASNLLERCRETGDVADARRAEQLARRSVTRHARRGAGWRLLARSLLTQHQFKPAEAAAARALALDSHDAAALALRADIRTELGDYDAAWRDLAAAERTAVTADTLAQRARLLDLHGRTQEALLALEQARGQVDGEHDLPRPVVAWFHMRVGDMHAALGHGSEAEQGYREALLFHSRDHRTCAALARLTAAQGRWRQAAEWAAQGARILPTPELCALQGDAAAALGKPADAEAQYRLIDDFGRLGRDDAGAFERQRAMFLADHGRALPEALALARHELTERHDILAWDTLAWTAYQNRLITDAEQAMQHALALGTRDARLHYHAGMIALAAGRPGATDHLERALRHRTVLSARDADLARCALAGARREAP